MWEEGHHPRLTPPPPSPFPFGQPVVSSVSYLWRLDYIEQCHSTLKPPSFLSLPWYFFIIKKKRKERKKKRKVNDELIDLLCAICYDCSPVFKLNTCMTFTGSNIRVGSPGNLEACTIVEAKFKHPCQPTSVEICHYFSLWLKNKVEVTETEIDLPRQKARSLANVPRHNSS